MQAWNDEAARVVETAFAAAVDDSLWPDLTERIVATTGARGGFLGILNHKTGQAVRCVLTHASAKAYEEYMGGMAQCDPQARMVAKVGFGSVYTSRSHVDWTDPVSADYMSWQVDRLGWHSHVTVASPLDEHHAYGLSIHLDRDDAPRLPELREFLTPIAGAVSQALQLGIVHNDKLTSEYWLGASAGLDPLGALLLDEYGSVLRMNETAERFVAAGRPFTLRGGRPTCAVHADQERIDAIVGRAAARIGAAPGAALLRAPFEQRWFVRVLPIVRKRRLMVIDEPAALMTVRALESRTATHVGLWRDLFDLTPKEASVADGLRRGLSAEAIAARMGMKAATVRTHTKVIHDKTETRRNAELAHLLTLLANP